jgi:DNA processing protein
MSLYLTVGYPKAELSSCDSESNLKYWLWLQGLKNLSSQKKRELLQAYGSPKKIFQLSPEQMGIAAATLSEGYGRGFDALRQKQLVRSEWMVQECLAQDIGILTWSDYRYRSMVRGYSLAPLLLFYRGTLANPIRPVVNLVADPLEQRQAISQIPRVCSYYRERGYVIATGLTFGCGTRMIEKIVEHADTLITFCSGGLDRCYPLDNYRVLDRIVEKGALVSAHAMKVAPSTQRSLERDRLLGNWCNETVVLGRLESIKASRSIRYAFEVGRGVYKAEDLERIDQTSAVAETPLTIGSAPIGSDDAALGSFLFELLQHVPMTTDDVAESLHIEEDRALRLLMDMELCGSIEGFSDGRWQVRQSASTGM